jgi:hypothetical protein
MSLLACAVRLGVPALAATDEEVAKAIEQAKAALMKSQQTQWTLSVYQRERRMVRKKVPEGGRMVEKEVREEWEEVPRDTFHGRLVEDHPEGIVFRAADGRMIPAARERVAYVEPPGHFFPEQPGSKAGGASALATLAMLEAGVTHHDPHIKAALQCLEPRDLQMTYSRAIRANLYAQLMARVRDDRRLYAHFRQLLGEDMRWLEGAMSEDGWYHYGSRTGRGQGDNSCTQFGVLGMWACANANMEIGDDYWAAVEQHWLETQGANGGWSYTGRPSNSHPATPTMTAAGVNTLYVVLDKLHTRIEPPYQWLKGVKPTPKVRAAIEQDFAAIDRGLDWLAKNGGATLSSPYPGYQLFGLERLGVASGLKYIGQTDWYAANVDAVIRHPWTGEPVNDGFFLLFLVYGQAPILFNKLQWGHPDQWNYYFRDLHYLCRFLNQEFESINKWQIVTLDSPLHDLLDAPILYISGSGEFAPTGEKLKRLRDYCEAGGAVIGHPNRDDKKFTESFKKTLLGLFRDREYAFEILPKDHPIYSTHFGKGAENRFRRHVPLEGMDDGGRTFVILFGGDVAGAWHQDRFVTCADAFRIMANIRYYAAPGNEFLPGRLRPKGLPGKPARLLGTLKVGRVEHAGDWDANPTAWMRMGSLLRHYNGVGIEETKGVKLDNAVALKGFDLLHLTGHEPLKLTESQQEGLKRYMADGGMVLMDAAAGNQSFAASAGKLIEAMFPEKGILLPAVHPIVQGGPAGAKPLERLRPTQWSGTRLRGRTAPPFTVVREGDRVALLFAPFDLTASMDGHYIYGMHGYRRESALKIMTNLLLWRFSERPAPTTSSQPTSKPS